MRELLFILTPTDGVPQTLTTSPDGWDESFIITERSRKYHGIFRSFTIPLKFVKQGATIIRDEFYRYGMAATCIIQVQKLNRQTLTYFTAYTGKIDFATFKDHDNDIEVMAVDGGLSQIIKINETNEFDFTAVPLVAENGIAIKYTYSPPGDYYVHAMKPYYFFESLVNKLTNGGIANSTYAVKSTYLTELGEWLILSTGQAWRLNNSATDPEMITFRTTLDDFFKSINAIGCIGMGIETIAGVETLVIEEREYFYNKNVIKSVESAKTLTLGFVSEFNIGRIIGGYPEKDYSDVTISDKEVCTFTNYQMPTTFKGTDYDIQSKYRADWQGIQKIVDDFPTIGVDNDIDYDIYFHDVVFRTPYYELWSGYCSTGTPFEIFNPRISPRNNLLNHVRFLNSCAYKMSGSYISFVNGGNLQQFNFVSIYPEIYPITQGEFEYWPILISDSDTWFRPFEINIEAAYPSDMVNLIAANPYGVIEFDYKKTTYTGYILKMETKLSGAGSVKYSLLCTDTNDLTKLIR